MIIYPEIIQKYSTEIGNYYTLKNFSLAGNNTRSLKKIYGKSYIMDITTFLYYHHMQEKLGQYIFLKKHIPDLKLILLGTNHYPYAADAFDPKQSAGVLEDSLRIIGINKEDFIFLKDTSIWFQETIYMNNNFNSFLKGFPDRYIGDDETRSSIIQATREKYRSKLIKSKPIKIYVSRGPYTEWYRYFFDLYEKITDGLATEEQIVEWDNFYNMPNTNKLFSTRNHIFGRYLSVEDNEKLEQFFKDKGYLVIDPMKTPFEEQLSLFYNATHIASITGSGLHNSIFANSDTNIFILHLSNGYRYDHDTDLRVVNNNIYEVPCSRLDFDGDILESFKLNDILSYLENNYFNIL